MEMTSLENQLDLAERIRKRWQPERRKDSAVYYGPLIDADKTYEGARNDVLDLLDVVATLQAELAACRQMCQRVATEAGQGGLTADHCFKAAMMFERETFIINTPSKRDEISALAKVFREAGQRMEASDDSE